MRICLIAEGSYPYITGGVSSWIHSLITNMPEHEFVIIAIAAETSQKSRFKYTLPDNLVEVKEIFLDSYLNESGEWGHQFRLSDEQRSAVRSLLGGDGHVQWSGIFELLRSPQMKAAADFLMSRDYFDILSELCAEKYVHVPFTEIFWTVRSMVLPLFLTIRSDIPEADLYHSVSTGYAGVIGALAKFLYRKPFFLTEHGIYSREREEEIIKADWVKGYFKDLWIDYFYRLSEAAYGMSDEVITLFNRNREIEIEIGCEAEKIRLIPNGVNVTDYASVAGMPVQTDGKLRIGAIVRIVPIKDIKTMIQAFALVKRELPEAELYIMGPAEEDPEYLLECRQLVESLQVDDIIFTGEVNIREYLARMEIILLSSVSEGMPLALLEAMAAAKPCVATDVGSCRELIWGHDDGIGQSGFVVPVMHYDQMAASVIQLGKSRSLREQMGRNGLARAEKHYGREAFIAKYRALYQAYEEVT
ncbi:GT4 family glycosyltransferase PelF [Paenibacillus methanolicus]|uniref:Glycosyltransferase involved in cell wall biosynthesis n=1 Tax=Paenibacillus methanolicus TaxID=582686 RepID=A0A5S5BQQ6_9BACL|nr:GT4 family glycosyltransferase PelF [Paenibacillus methanolicus]TYP68636.1 glycosyltransferase involved in cell wall biosynthesis [Paenibacillus methanolicus]